MSAHEALASASGLRPMSAFVVIGAVVVGVAGRTVKLALGGAPQPDRVRLERGSPPAYSIEDRTGRTIASFVPRFDLELSPRSLWQAHTPRRIAEALSIALGGTPSATELLSSMLPDARDGVIEVETLPLSARAAQRVQAWIEAGGGGGGGPLEGVWLEPEGEGSFHLAWRPEVLLSEELRRRSGSSQAARWTRRIAGGLDACLREPGAEPRLLPEPEARARREAIWKALLPTAFCLAVRGIEPDRILALRSELERQGVASLQMRIAYGRDRAYPAGPHELFGSWGWIDASRTEPEPREGLELACDRLLSTPPFSLLELRPERYSWIDDRPVRGQRARSYLAFAPASEPVVIETSLDLALQGFLREELERTRSEHDAALAQAIVLDVASGDVLAVDAVERYPIHPFAPIYHVFTTGSTFKVLTMAVALEERAVEPTTLFDVGTGEYRITYPDGRPSGRTIHEAEGALTGLHTSAQLFAFSVNAGLAQIGLRVPAGRFHAYLDALGYGRPAGSGLGPERAGNLPPLPWKYAYTHASVGFGHEISTTLWQHAAALATVVRGGVFRQLRLVHAAVQGDRRIAVPPDEGRRVFAEATCEKVREMMRLGAEIGTGKEVRAAFEASVRAWAGRDVPAEAFDIGTKTGTAQKVPSEVCVHVELAERARWEREGLAPARERTDALARLAKPHARCYTSSICAFGRAPGSERELMVLVVVDEPCGQERFGSRVAGPAAQAILAEALGLTHGGRSPRFDLAPGFAESGLTLQGEAAQPWEGGP